MCGINGFNWKDAKLVRKMNNSIGHRGPDDEGIYVDNLFSLGHKRLAILDLSDKGHQPMFYSKKFGACSKKYNKKNIPMSNIGIVFNGEIYNFKEIKKGLIKKGYIFNSETDTEVILASYLEWGQDCVKRFNGMWAFCIYNLDKKELFLSRDRFGQKPLYYFNRDGVFIFSSEMKGIFDHKIEVKPNRGSFIEYFQSSKSISFVSESMIDSIKAFPPAMNAIFRTKDKKIIITPYDSFPYLNQDVYLSNLKRNEKYLVDKLDEVLNEVVKRHMVADVEVSCLCSGGLDSSLIAAIAKKHNSNVKIYCVDTCDSKTSEIKYARKVARHLRLELGEIKIKKEDFEKLLKKTTYHLEAPLVHPNTVAIYLLFQRIKRERIKVVLSGEGADEVFGGYTPLVQVNIIHKIKYFLNKLNINFETKINDSKKLVLLMSFLSSLFNSKKINEFFTYNNLFNNYIEDGISNYKNKFGNNYLKDIESKYSFLKNDSKFSEIFLSKQLREYIVPLLRRADKIGMAHGIEVRIPFLDHELIKFSSNLPMKFKVNFLERKYLLKKVAERYLPKEIVYRKKSGFPLPFEKWYGLTEINSNLKEKFFLEFENIFLNDSLA